MADIHWAIYIAFTIMVNVTIMNLLISIIGNQLDEILLTQTSTDIQIKTEILLIK